MQSLLPDKFGKFKVIREIGKGGFGVVYEGRDPVLKRLVAIKTCNTDDEGLRLRFQREAEIVASLQHPNITTVHDLGVENGVPYLVQEYLSGKDLSQVILARKPVPLARKVEILKGVASGLEQAHRRGIIHRDIKPGNIRLLDDGSVKVMDFGIAKLLADTDTQLTQTGMMIGTAAYLAPEQVSDVEVDHRCDIFSFGVVAYELLTYQRPFSGTTISALLYKINHDAHAPIASVFPEAPPALASLVDDCLSKDPDGRPLSFTDVLRRLDGGKAIRRNASEDATKLLRGDAGPPMAEPQRSSEDLAGGATVITPRAEVTLTTDPLAQTILETQVETGGGGAPSTAERVVTESAMSQMFQKASRPSVLAVAVMAAIAAGAVWFGLSRGSSQQEEALLAASVVSSAETLSASAEPASADSAAITELESPSPNLGSVAIGADPSKTEHSLRRQTAASRPESGGPSRGGAAKNPSSATQSNERGIAPGKASNRGRETPKETAPAKVESSSKPAEQFEPKATTASADRTAPNRSGERTAAPATNGSVPVDTSSKASSGSTSNGQPSTIPTKSVKSATSAPAPPAVSVPASIDHEPALRRVLDAYADAIQNMDARALETIWPSLSSSQLSRFESSFSSARVMEIEISRCTFEISSSSATATCRVTRGITPKAGRPQSNTSTRTFRFRLRGTAWALESV